MELYKSRQIMRYFYCVFMDIAQMIRSIFKRDVLRVVLVDRLQYRGEVEAGKDL